MREITGLLLAWRDGDPEALRQLTPLVYDRLHRLARAHMRGERDGHTLQPTALVHEAYLKLFDCRRLDWQNRAQFYGLAARIMRRILVDYARSRNYAKRGGGARPVSLDEEAILVPERSRDFVALDDALKSLEARDPRKSRTVELRFLGGLSVEETAVVLDISPRTVRRDWNMAKAWLYRELTSSHETSTRAEA